MIRFRPPPDSTPFRVTDLTTFTPNTICAAADLTADIKLIQRRGFSFDDEQKAIGIRCIAAPIVNDQGQAVAGISISGPSHRVTPEMVPKIGALVKAAGDAASRSLGADITL